MKILAILGEILPVLGTIGLLGLWLYQQTEVERRASELRKLASARTVFQTYQSHNAVFNAINELRGAENASEELRRFQVYNYELGLEAIEKALPQADREDIPPRLANTASTTRMDRTQQRLELLQTRLAAREEAVQQSADAAAKRCLWCYAGLSAVSILGTVCAIIGKLAVVPL